MGSTAGLSRNIAMVISAGRNTTQFLRFLFHRFDADEGRSIAAALAYTSLLALVPLLTIGFTLLTAFPVFETLSGKLQSFIFQNFIPATGDVVQAYLERFTTRASGLTTVGVIFLVITSIALISTIERALNRIWRVTQRRSRLSAFLVYWAILTLGPVLVAVSIAVSSYLLAAAGNLEATAGLRLPLLKLAPTLAIWVAFSLLYALLPNRRINFGHALLGAALAALLFEGAKKGFASYVTHFPGYETIYGALATLLLFQVWIYLSWLIVLFGAQFAASLSAYPRRKRASTSQATLYHGLILLGELWDAQKEGNARSSSALLGEVDSLGERELIALLGLLADAKILQRTTDGHWLLSRDLDHLTIAEVEQALQTVPLRLPEQGVEPSARLITIRAEIERLAAHRTEGGSRSVASLL